MQKLLVIMALLPALLFSAYPTTAEEAYQPVYECQTNECYLPAAECTQSCTGSTDECTQQCAEFYMDCIRGCMVTKGIPAQCAGLLNGLGGTDPDYVECVLNNAPATGYDDGSSDYGYDDSGYGDDYENYPDWPQESNPGCCTGLVLFMGVAGLLAVARAH